MMGTWRFFILFSVLLCMFEIFHHKKLTQIQNNPSNKHLLSTSCGRLFWVLNFYFPLPFLKRIIHPYPLLCDLQCHLWEEYSSLAHWQWAWPYDLLVANDMWMIYVHHDWGEAVRAPACLHQFPCSFPLPCKWHITDKGLLQPGFQICCSQSTADKV